MFYALTSRRRAALHSVAISCGFRGKRRGHQLLRSCYILAVRSTAHMLDVPLMVGGTVIANDTYMASLCQVAKGGSSVRLNFVALLSWRRYSRPFPAAPPASCAAALWRVAGVSRPRGVLLRVPRELPFP